MFLIPYIWSALVACFTWLAAALGSIFIGAFSWGIGGLIAWAGIGYVTYSGVKSLFDHIYNKLADYYLDLPMQILQILSIARVDDAISVIFSAYATKFIIKGVWTAYSSISLLKH